MATSGKYIYWNEGTGADASGDASAIPVESFRGFDVGTDTLAVYFDPLSGTQINRMLVNLTVADGKQIEVAKAICNAMATMNAGILTLADDDNSVYLHSAITAVGDSASIDAA
tara:strand:- start:177 stop:515 length:339 start_codon:yes stop_codon:yes gene_type:complete